MVIEEMISIGKSLLVDLEVPVIPSTLAFHFCKDHPWENPLEVTAGLEL
jgi:hypothetical protein